jgi:FAD/FMN-containing dehydrogenase
VDGKQVITRHVRALLGTEAIIGTGSADQPLVAPADEAAASLLLRTAASEGWRVGIVGGGRWCPTDTPADLLVSSRRMDRIPLVSAADLVATAGAGAAWSGLRRALAEHGVWLAADPPGPERTVGSVIATGTSGPLAAGFGRLRDHLLGVTFVSGEGRVVSAGGRVVKNVAGYDLTKLAIGSYGAFGIITSVTLRVRAVPRADSTLVTSGPRDELIDAALAVTDAGMSPSALELCRGAGELGSQWTLAARLTGRDAEVAAAAVAVRQATDVIWRDLGRDEAAGFWTSVQQAMSSGPATVRLGTLPTAIEPCLDLVQHRLREGSISVTVPLGRVRWCGPMNPEDLQRLRQAAAQREIPLTLERGSWMLRAAVGHYGAYREGVGPLVAELRRAFDPRDVLLVPIGDDG